MSRRLDLVNRPLDLVSRPLDLLLVASGGQKLGLGHAMRCATLAQAAESRGLRTAFALRGEGAVRDAVAGEIPGIPLRPWRGPEDVAGLAAWTVLDTREPCAAEIRAAHDAGGATVVLDRTDHLDLATWTILPILHAAPNDHPRLRTGSGWCMVPRTLRRATVPGHPGARDILLVSMGGADPLDLTSAVAEPLEQAMARWPASGNPPRIHGVIGPAFAAPQRLARRLSAMGWEVHVAPSRDDLAKLMRRSLAALVGFGTSVYELAYLGVPMLYVTHHRDDLTSAARLERRGVGVAAGFGGDLKGSELTALLQQTISDPAWCTASSRSGRQAVGEADGAERLLDLIKENPS